MSREFNALAGGLFMRDRDQVTIALDQKRRIRDHREDPRQDTAGAAADRKLIDGSHDACRSCCIRVSSISARAHIPR